MLPKFSENENPRQLSLEAVDCGSGISVSCVDCNIVKLTDAQGTEKLIFANPIQVRVNDPQEDCANNDYRRESDNLQPHVVIFAMDADNTENYFKPFSFSLFPEEGQSAQELAQSLKDAICACSEQIIPDPLPPYERIYQSYSTTEAGYSNATATFSNILGGVRSVVADQTYKFDFSTDAFVANSAESMEIQFLIDGAVVWTMQTNSTTTKVFSAHWVWTATENKDINLVIQARATTATHAAQANTASITADLLASE